MDEYVGFLDDDEVPDCGHPTATLRYDPFIAEVYNQNVKRIMCDDCWLQRKEEV